MVCFCSMSNKWIVKALLTDMRLQNYGNQEYLKVFLANMINNLSWTKQYLKSLVLGFPVDERLKGKLRSRNILPYIKAHMPSVSKIVVIWCSTDLNFRSGALKSFEITTLEHQRPPSLTLGMASRLWRDISQGLTQLICGVWAQT